MNPGDKVSISLLTTGNEAGRILAILAYHGTIPLFKRALQRKAGDTIGRVLPSSDLLS